jgi:transcriptional regulator with XRE-family HTH domain
VAFTPVNRGGRRNRIRERREAAGLSKLDLARLTGLDRATIHRAETGRTLPRATTLALLAIALDCAPMDLVYVRWVNDQ